jgi:hypothetical protein
MPDKITVDVKNPIAGGSSLKELTQQTAEEIGVWLEDHSFGQYKEAFLAHNITGACVPMLERDDLKKIGVDKVGDRLILLDLLEEYRIATAISNRTEVVLKWNEYHYTCCHPFSNVYYTLTPSSLEIQRDSGFMGLAKQSVDISTITDVTLESRGCGGCCYGIVSVITNKGGVRMRVKRSNSAKVHTAIKRTWEGFQASRTGKFKR